MVELLDIDFEKEDLQYEELVLNKKIVSESSY
jgi:hypothetical protein